MVSLILTHDVVGLGEEGDLVKVKSGYARNYLLPKGYALIQTPNNLRILERKKEVIEKRKEEKRVLNASLKEKIEATTLSLERRVAEGLKLYGSVSASDLVELLNEQEINILKQNIEMPGPLKLIGDYQIQIKLSSGEKAELKVVIKPLAD